MPTQMTDKLKELDLAVHGHSLIVDIGQMKDIADSEYRRAQQDGRKGLGLAMCDNKRLITSQLYAKVHERLPAVLVKAHNAGKTDAKQRYVKEIRTLPDAINMQEIKIRVMEQQKVHSKILLPLFS